LVIEPSFLAQSFILYSCFTSCSADLSGDGLLSLQELSDWINEKIQEHINEALRENFGLFVAIDNNPRNGRLALCDLYLSACIEIHVYTFLNL
jgi:hypothetical protein